MIPGCHRETELVQAGRRKQQGGEGLVRIVLLQGLIDEADRQDL